ncbi:MAG: hypothetical protein CFK52_13065 [Chloracidobacterium sp. CP2_5A]|nr:MAG: hypothetical protein CFK52_13065 [Chloracidobacterium sp. CP2_5A]
MKTAVSQRPSLILAQPDAIALPADFDPDLTLRGGQAFRWTVEPDSNGQTAYRGVVEDMTLLVAPAAGQWQARLLNHPPTPPRLARLRDYFDLDRDYAAARQALLERVERVAPLARLSGEIERARGLRILRQPWFETLVAFVISANNHLPRIRQIINVISLKFGQPLGSGDYAFPTPEALAAVAPATLRGECRVGYRDRYLCQLAQRIARERLAWEQAATRPTLELRQALQTLPGVGPKVAECVLLFGFHRWEAFPIDVWVRRAMTGALVAPAPDGRPPADRQIAAAAAARFGPLAGLAQQYLFEIARRHKPKADNASAGDNRSSPRPRA